MADINLTQAEADALIAMEKHRVTDERTDVWTAFEDFMRFCNITRPPNVKQELLT